MRRACEQADFHVLEHAAHFLKGSCGQFGAETLHRLCGAIERAAREGQLAEIPGLLDVAAEEAERVTAALQAELKPTLV